MASYFQQQVKALEIAGRMEPAAHMIIRQDGLMAFAFAFVTFSVVPFLGILFCPAAVLLALCALMRRTGPSRTGNLRRPAAAMALAVTFSVIQVGLWWMLTHVPGAGRF